MWNGLRVCAKIAKCRRVYARLRRASPGGDPFADAAVMACDRCGQPTTSAVGVCSRSAECKAERQRRDKRDKAGTPAAPCEVCGASMRWSKSGVCSRTAACRREAVRRSRLAHLDTRRADDRNRWANLTADQRESERKADRARYAADPSIKRASAIRWLQRTDRPCKHAAEGCAKLALAGSHYCREHHRADVKLKRERRQVKLKTRLAERQGGLCPWCEEELPDDLDAVHVDHVIPKASGVIIEDDWNLRVLHARCNIVKGHKLTAAAIALAVGRGVNLPLAA